MARSNNSDRSGAPSGRPVRPAPAVDHGLPWANQAEQPGFDAPPAGQLPWPQQGQPQYAPPQAGYPQQGYAQPGYPPQQGYAGDPQFDQYLPQGGQQPGYPAAAAHPDPAAHLRGSYAPQTEPGYAYPSQAGHDPRTQDPQSYEFGAYATQPQGYANPAMGRTQAAPPPPQGYAPAYGQQPHPQHGYEQGFAPAHAAGAAPDQHDDEYDDEDDDAEAPRRFGFFKIAASLVVAIGLGGGAAYTYKTYGSKLTGGHAPIVLKADATPAKSLVAAQNGSQPGNGSGGDRVGDTVPQVVPIGDGAGTDSVPAGARKVQTIAITPGAQASNEPALRPTLTMPGLAVEGLPSAAAPQRGPAPVAAAPAPAGRAAATAPIAPKVIASLEQPAATATAAVAPKTVVVAKAPKPSDAFTPPGQGTAAAPAATAPVATAAAASATAAVAPAPAKTGGNGYVAVLFSSQGNAINARKDLDALQSKYNDVLGGKPTDVTEVTVKGQQYFRAIVGPPGSREAVKTLCGQLLAAGHKDCFAAAY